MELWVARTKDGWEKGYLAIFKEKPIYLEYKDEWVDSYGSLNIPNHKFPEVTFENSPQKVELKLINGEKGLIVPNLQTSNPALKCNTRCRN